MGQEEESFLPFSLCKIQGTRELHGQIVFLFFVFFVFLDAHAKRQTFCELD